jgi:c(7)-type cytochrome triheme protein
MPTYLRQRKTRRSKRAPVLFILGCAVALIGNFTLAQIYLPKPPPQPEDYGKVILNNHATEGPGPVIFDHWLHRSMFTCRVCHVDVGFAMEAKATGISASTNRAGFHCGACHDGKRLFEGRPIFAACSDAPPGKQCERCHSSSKKDVRKYEYSEFTAKFPKDTYGVNWDAAEKSRLIHPVDVLEGLSMKKAPMPSREDLTVKAAYSWVHPIVFSHEKHSMWNGCELCHPEIFPAAKKGTFRYSMFSNIEGRYCGACHGSVAFPLNNCQRCHPNGPLWAP